MVNRLTRFGFDWGPIQVQRACVDGRYHTLLIQTGHWEIQLSVSPTGRAVHLSKQKRSTRTSAAEQSK